MNGPGPQHVLIVEPRADYRQTLDLMLRRIGAERVVAAAEGGEALAILQNGTEPIELLVSNLDLNGMDGLEFIRHATRLGIGGLILYSKQDDAVRSSAEWMARAYRAPLLGVLGVPFRLSEFEALARKRKANCTIYSDVVSRATRTEDTDRDVMQEIQFALDARSFAPHFQPKICLSTGALRGAEVLVRWEHPELGLLAPIHFIDLMERSDLIDPLTHQVLERSAEHVVSWAAEGLDVNLAINVSPLTLERPGCAKRLLETIARAGARPEQFTFEITEHAFARDATTVLENVLRLRMKGCGIAVDDFGTGYSSLQQLNRTPITELKLDRSFVRRMKSNGKALSIIEATLDLASRLKLKTVAEGIDNEEQRASLMSLGCQTGQGYLFARPMDGLRFEGWCNDRQPLAA